jgi:hypothetical protein
LNNMPHFGYTKCLNISLISSVYLRDPSPYI